MQVKGNTNIVQSNFLLENRPKLTKDETRLFITIIGAVNKDDEDFKPLEIPVMEFARLWGMEINAAYRKIKAALRSLRAKEFFVEGVNKKTGKTRFLTASYISAATYEQGEGYATVEISQMFKPYLLELQKNYTRYVLENILNLSTVNAIRNYELLKQYESLGKRSFTVEEYKKLLGIEDKYSRNTDLRVNVIEPAYKEINESTDLTIEYEIQGRGKSARIVFTIQGKEKKKAQQANDSQGGEGPKKEPDIPQQQDTNEHTDFEMKLLEEIPAEVHNGEIERVRAILDIGRKYIVADFLDYLEVDEFDDGASRLRKISQAMQNATADCNYRILDAVRTFNIREYQVRKKNIRTSSYAYFLAAFEAWLMNHVG